MSDIGAGTYTWTLTAQTNSSACDYILSSANQGVVYALEFA
jgi:hypothetical protein